MDLDMDSNILRRISISDNENDHRNDRNFNVLEEEEDLSMDSFIKPRKRRLDHLTWEEKIQRKKLKNRVAAQTSRDRKKAKMEQLEESFDKLFAQNEAVLAECGNLRKMNEALARENAELRQALRLGAGGEEPQGRRVECDSHPSGSTESVTLLQQQGVAAHSAAALALRMLLACLLCRTSSTSSTRTSMLAASTSSRRACSPISRSTLMRWITTLNSNTRLVNPLALEKWWGRHQNSWNPMETAAA